MAGESSLVAFAGRIHYCAGRQRRQVISANNITRNIMYALHKHSIFGPEEEPVLTFYPGRALLCCAELLRCASGGRAGEPGERRPLTSEPVAGWALVNVSALGAASGTGGRRHSTLFIWAQRRCYDGHWLPTTS